MRPVRLDLDGFAAFREPASVEFTDVDYFALVGNTGSGKSTIIDALCFALYGTAPRWGRANAVSDALAPTANRAVVSLVFDIGGERYQVVREVRRTGQTVTTKQARLERILDPTVVPAPGDAVETEVLVSEVRALTGAVEELLGLEFAEFCQCVVLPQGEFARFLKATSGERQAILLKLLGAESYKRMQKSATARAKQAETQAEVLSSQLAGHSASPQARDEATARVVALDEAATRARELASAHARGTEQVEVAATRVARAREGLEVLTDVAVPDGAEHRQRAVVDGRRLLEQTRVAESAAETALTLATDAMRATATRPALERVRADRARHGEAVAEHTRGLQQAADLEKEHAAARTDADRAQTAEQTATHEDAAAQRARQQATTEFEHLTTQAVALADITMPVGVAESADALEQLRVSRVEAEQRLAVLESEVTARRHAIAAMPDQRALGDVDHRCVELDEIAVQQDTVSARRQHAVAAAAAADDALAEAQRHEISAGQTWAAARVTASATALRSGLAVDDDCPVCTHRIDAALMERWQPSEDDSALATLATAAEQAQHDLTTAREASATAHAEVSAAEQEQRSLAEQAGYRHRELRERLQRMATACGLQDLQLTDADDTRTLAAAAATVRSAVAGASSEVTRLDGEAGSLRTSVERHRTREVELEEAQRAAELALVATRSTWATAGAPATTSDVAAGWHELVTWADQQIDDLRSAAIPVAEKTLAQASQATEDTAAALTRAREDRIAAESRWREQERERAALEATQRALQSTIAELDAALVTAPSADELPALLQQADTVAEAQAEAEEAHRDRREERRAAEQRSLEVQQGSDGDREALSVLRDRAAPWQPPTFTPAQLEHDIAEAWRQMAQWSASRTADIGAELASATAEQETHQREVETISAQVQALVAETGVDLPETTSVAEVREALAVALTRAQGEERAIEKELAAAAELVTQIAEATERARVSAELASLLRADKFQQWLAGAALDTLVAGASSSLEKLSEGRFSLTHDKGDFFVLDHFDADSRRSVKTLSGGETFQTSLALALALSEQLAALASGGSARLESIFLDEGFGTLDPDSLETVAGTLETLASGKRMVGVVTHVAALAERIPVRYRVSADSRSSHVVREGD